MLYWYCYCTVQYTIILQFKFCIKLVCRLPLGHSTVFCHVIINFDWCEDNYERRDQKSAALSNNVKWSGWSMGGSSHHYLTYVYWRTEFIVSWCLLKRIKNILLLKTAFGILYHFLVTWISLNLILNSLQRTRSFSGWLRCLRRLTEGILATMSILEINWAERFLLLLLLLRGNH